MSTDRNLASAEGNELRALLVECREFIDTTQTPAYPAGASLADRIDKLLAALLDVEHKGKAAEAWRLTGASSPEEYAQFQCWLAYGKPLQTAEASQPAQQHLPLAVSSAPEHIWLDLGFDPAEEDAHFSNLNTPTWSKDNATGYGIKYIRADLATYKPPADESEPSEAQIITFLDTFQNDRKLVGDYEAFRGVAVDIWQEARREPGPKHIVIPPGWTIRDRSDLEPGAIDIEGPGHQRMNLSANHGNSAWRMLHELGNALLESPAPVPERPTKPGWYVVLPPDFDEPKVRAFGKDGQWWIPLGKGNGDDGWMSGREYQNWVGPIADIDDRQPFLPKLSAQAVAHGDGIKEALERAAVTGGAAADAGIDGAGVAAAIRALADSFVPMQQKEQP